MLLKGEMYDRPLKPFTHAVQSGMDRIGTPRGIRLFYALDRPAGKAAGPYPQSGGLGSPDPSPGGRG